jgi:hypothetical protein
MPNALLLYYRQHIASVGKIIDTILCLVRFFEDYKKNEHKEVIVDDILGAEEAKKVVKDSLVSV